MMPIFTRTTKKPKRPLHIHARGPLGNTRDIVALTLANRKHADKVDHNSTSTWKHGSPTVDRSSTFRLRLACVLSLWPALVRTAIGWPAAYSVERSPVSGRWSFSQAAMCSAARSEAPGLATLLPQLHERRPLPASARASRPARRVPIGKFIRGVTPRQVLGKHHCRRPGD